MPTIQDYTGSWLQGIQVGSRIGAQIAENRREQQRLNVLMEQTKLANEITQRRQAIADAQAVQEATLFRQQAEFANRVQNTPVPGGGDFEAMAPEDQAGAIQSRNRQVMQFAPQDQLGRLLQSDTAEFGREQRDIARDRATEERRAATQAAIDARRQESLDASLARQDISIKAAQAAAEKAQQASMKRAEFTQGEITERAGQRQKDKADEFPFGSPAAIYETLLDQKAAGAVEGAVEKGVYKEGGKSGGVLGLFGSTQPIDKLIEEAATKVPPAVRRKIEKKVDAATEEPAAVAAEVSEPVEVVRIRVISPDGKTIGTVPADKLDEALKRGYKRADKN